MRRINADQKRIESVKIRRIRFIRVPISQKECEVLASQV
jgi:hypothetical protein